MIKSLLNYVGGKYKLLQQILPLFPKDIDTFYDVFGGGGNVAINANANKVVYNDLNLRVVQILEAFKNTPHRGITLRDRKVHSSLRVK